MADLEKRNPVELARHIRQRKNEIGDRKGERGDVIGAARGKTAEIIAKELGMSSSSVEKYDRLNELDSSMLALVESGRIKPTIAAMFSKLTHEYQSALAASIASDPNLQVTAKFVKMTVDKVKSAGRQESQYLVPKSHYDELVRKVRELEGEVDGYKKLFKAHEMGGIREVSSFMRSWQWDRSRTESWAISTTLLIEFEKLLTDLEKRGVITDSWRGLRVEAERQALNALRGSDRLEDAVKSKF